jgi:ATP-dependent Clp protease ATP-binding subunit ClpA
MMSQKLEVVINSAVKMANVLRHEFLSLEGLLYALLDDDAVNNVLIECGADVHGMREELEVFLRDEENFSILTDADIEELSEQQFLDEELRKLAKESGVRYQPEVSLSLQRVLQRAAINVQAAGKKDIRAINLLVSIFHEKESFALYLLDKNGVERFEVIKIIAHGFDEALENGEEEADFSELGAQNTEGADADSEDGKKRKSALEEFTQNLNQLAKQDKIDPIIGREEEIKRIVQVLCRRRKNNPLLVGEAGVGKTAIAEGLALAIINNEVPEVLSDAVIYSLDLAALLAGAKFRGDFEKRLKNVLRELEKKNDSGVQTILFIDEIHTLMGAGATSGGSLDASNLLKPSLSAGKIRCMGSTTHEEYRSHIEKDSAFHRRFQKVDIEEPSLEDTYKILKGLKSYFEGHHNVKYSNSVLKKAVDLADKHISDKKNPDKAIDVIDEAGAAIQLLPSSKRRTKITKKDIEQIVANLAKIPQLSVAGDEKDVLKNLNSNLKMMIYGQDEAVTQVSDAILLSRSGLGTENKPMASFLFAGPTGVGKTELARQLATNIGSHLERFDMSEYMEKHSIAKLIGAPPGYVGFDKGGILTDAIKKHPHCVLLLDEIEKAHIDIFNVLLQVMDHGVLTDSHGRSTDFHNVIIIMTTNAGAKDYEAGSIGLGAQSNKNEAKREKAIKNFFSPEFRNRLDAIIHFNKLDNEFIIRIVEKFLTQLEQKLALKNVELLVSQKAKLWLAKEGYDPKMGARPISRLIDNLIKKPLANEVLFGKLEKGGKVLTDIDDKNKIFFNYS